MKLRLVGALCGAALLLATPTDLAQAQSNARATTVKSSKSNTSDRATTVKSSKSNTSDRMGGGGGGAKPAGFVMSFDVRTQTEYKSKRTRKQGRTR
jgi:hypothetical protein